MITRPKIVLKAALSLDGCIDDSSPQRRVFSSPEDRRRVMELRACSDAILVGAETVRKDNPHLTIDVQELKQQRIAAGKRPNPMRVTLSKTGNFPADANFFLPDGTDKLIYLPAAVQSLPSALTDKATVIACPGEAGVALSYLVADLYLRGVKSVLVEGGSKLLGLFIQELLFDELRLAFAPVLLGVEETVKLFTRSWGKEIKLKLLCVEQLGDTVALTYIPRRS